jgi:hypothetical protein
MMVDQATVGRSGSRARRSRRWSAAACLGRAWSEGERRTLTSLPGCAFALIFHDEVVALPTTSKNRRCAFTDAMADRLHQDGRSRAALACVGLALA